MEITKVPRGEIAPEDSDCIKITALTDGRYELVTSALLQCDDDDEAVSEAVISGDEYDSYEQAEQAGVAWATECCVERLYIEVA